MSFYESFTESDEASTRLTILANQQQLLEDCWKPVRWLFDILSRFRNRGGISSGITFSLLNEWYAKQTDFPDDTAVFAKPSSTSSTNEQDDNVLMVCVFSNFLGPCTLSTPFC